MLIRQAIYENSLTRIARLVYLQSLTTDPTRTFAVLRVHGFRVLQPGGVILAFFLGGIRAFPPDCVEISQGRGCQKLLASAKIPVHYGIQNRKIPECANADGLLIYNKELVQRGNITLHIDKKCLRPAPRSKKTGRPQECSNALILRLVTSSCVGKSATQADQ